MSSTLNEWERVEPERQDQRTPYKRDRDRVLYSKEFRRLSGVTQVVRADESYYYHDRLSHSLKVAQVGTALTDLLIDRANDAGVDLTEFEQKTEPDEDMKGSIEAIVETACLAHDLGHPPFGHAIEEELNDLVEDRYGGFEGNAQSFRIIAKVAKQNKRYEGMNLTLGSLNAILKYPWGINDSRKEQKTKWGYYPSEDEIVDEIKDVVQNFGTRCIEAEIMDYADDVTYAVHDVDDFYRVGLVPLDQLLIDTDERRRFREYVCRKEDVTTNYVSEFFDWLRQNPAEDPLETPFNNTDKEIASLNKFSSFLIKRFLTITEPDNLFIKNNQGLQLSREADLEKEINILKRLTFYYVIENSNLRSQQYGQKQIIRTLFDEFKNQAKPDDDYHNIIPHPFRGRLRDVCSEEERIRTVVDLICSMTEQQAVDIYGRITGTNPGSIREGILR